MEQVSQITNSKLWESLQLIEGAVAYLANTAIETVCSTAKPGALINSARRAVWVKMWNGVLTSKNRLCNLPFEGSLLFDTGLDQALSRSSDKGLRFLPSLDRAGIDFFVSPRGDSEEEPSFREEALKQETLGCWEGQAKRGSPFFPTLSPTTRSLSDVRVGGRLSQLLPRWDSISEPPYSPDYKGGL